MLDGEKPTPTEEQIALLKKWAVDIPSGLTRMEASVIIKETIKQNENI